MEDKMNITFISDEGHGWGIITQHQLRAVARMSPMDFSSFSYETPNEELYALEEDQDFPRFLNKLDSMGIKYEINDRTVTEDDPDNPRNWRYITNWTDYFLADGWVRF
tara:strand:- start:158 stop:481 length:324 start_codon:yes stop_codon:yes gene_type:complete